MAELDWKLVKTVARNLGVRDKAIEKWWQRKSVPHRWRLPLIEATKGKISSEALKNGRDAIAD